MKMRIKQITVFILFFSIFLSCGTSKQTATTSVPEDSVIITKAEYEQLLEAIQEEEVERSVYHGTKKRTNDLLHTTLKVSFDWPKAELNGEAILTIKPYFYPTSELVLDAKGF